MTEHYSTLMGIARGYQRSQALAVAAELGIADLLRDGPRSADDLAAATGTDPRSLYRLLRALASIGVFDEGVHGGFALTAMGELLRRDHPQSIDPAVRLFCADYQWRAWASLGHSVRTGGNALVHTLGMDVWEHRRRHPDDGALFDSAMRTMADAYAEAFSRPTTSGVIGSSRTSAEVPARCSRPYCGPTRRSAGYSPSSPGSCSTRRQSSGVRAWPIG